MTSDVPKLNVANGLTLLRLVLVPFFVWALVLSSEDSSSSQMMRWVATILFVVASLTDFADGYIARRNQIETNFGKIADPIADKLLTGSALIWLSIQGLVWWWVTVVILIREIGITAYRFVVIKRAVVAAGRAGKIKTVSQLLAITLYLIHTDNSWLFVAHGVMAIALLLTIGTGVDYLARTRNKQAGLQKDL